MEEQLIEQEQGMDQEKLEMPHLLLELIILSRLKVHMINIM